jgi:hypothetical protein
MIREVDDPEDARGHPHVRLDVLRSPADPSKIMGTVRMSDTNPKHDIDSHHSAGPMEIETARRLAWKIARDYGADRIVISDPKNLYPKAERAQPPGT